MGTTWGQHAGNVDGGDDDDGHDNDDDGDDDDANSLE